MKIKQKKKTCLLVCMTTMVRAMKREQSADALSLKHRTAGDWSSVSSKTLSVFHFHVVFSAKLELSVLICKYSCDTLPR